MELLSNLCRQWADQYTELQLQRRQIDDTMQALAALITANGGQLPNPEYKPARQVATEPPKSKPADLHTDYDRTGSWAWKIEYVLKTIEHPVPVTDIADAINAIEPQLDLAKIVKAVTMEASKLGLNGRLGIKKKGNKNFYFIPKQTAGEQATIGFE